jgi:ribosomal protein S18 acetylase RimI-like enzyme
MSDLRLLDNPIWNSLTTEHINFSLGDGLARRYHREIGPLSGISEQTPAAYEALRSLAGPDGLQVLFLEEPPVKRPGWTLVRGGVLSQMVFARTDLPKPSALQANAELRVLTSADVPAMVELAKLTEPGPFRCRTCELGVFYGIFESGRLLAMAGQRTHVAGFIEVSAVCTHPDARGRGYARATMSVVMADILQREEIPYLHSFEDNYSAIRVYEGLGFRLRRSLHLAVLKGEK